jgi:hypothetical protein
MDRKHKDYKKAEDELKKLFDRLKTDIYESESDFQQVLCCWRDKYIETQETHCFDRNSAVWLGGRLVIWFYVRDVIQ